MEQRPSLSQIVPGPPSWRISWRDIEGSAIAPWIAQMKTIPQNPVWHGEGDVWTHTRMVCEELIALPQWRMLDKRKREEVFVAALFHDIGKIACTHMENGAWVSPSHSAVGSRMAREILWLKYGACGKPELMKFRETVCSLIRYHSVPLHILEQADTRRYAVKIASMGNLADDFSLSLLSILAMADMKGRICADRDELLEMVELFRLQAEEYGCSDAPFVFPNSCSEYAYLSGRNIFPDQKLYDDSWGEVIMMSALPGTGKDTWIRSYGNGLAEISLDKLRQLMNISPRDDQGKVINAAREQAKTHLRKKVPFIWNATDLTPATRGKQIQLFTAYHASVKIVYLETDWEEQMRRNSAREAAVPENEIRRMLRKMSPPACFEAHKVQWLCV